MLDVTILGRVYKVACKESERDELTQAVTLLDRRMREIREAGKVSGADRIAVMAALNLAHELLRTLRSIRRLRIRRNCSDARSATQRQ